MIHYKQNSKQLTIMVITQTVLISDAFLSSDATSWPSLELSLWLQLQQTANVNWWSKQTQYHN